MRKREMELNKVKERLLKVADKPVAGAAGSKPSIRIINPLPTVRATAAGRSAAAEQVGARAAALPARPPARPSASASNLTWPGLCGWCGAACSRWTRAVC